MAVIGYLETNFLLAAATGRDPDNAAVLATDPMKVRLCLPDVCVMEGWYAIQGQRKQFASFRAELDKRIHEAQRDKTSAVASTALPVLLNARLRAADLLDDLERRFRDVLRDVAQRCELLPLAELSLGTSLSQQHIDGPADNLILHIICQHAAAHPGQHRVLLTSNPRDFDSIHVRQVLAAFGIADLATDCRALLGHVQNAT